MDRFEAEEVLSRSTGGIRPSEGDALVYTRDGWDFRRNPAQGILTQDPMDPKEGDIWFRRDLDPVELRAYVNGEIITFSPKES